MSGTFCIKRRGLLIVGLIWLLWAGVSFLILKPGEHPYAGWFMLGMALSDLVIWAVSLLPPPPRRTDT